jgi:hypothetical protein
MPMRTHKQRDAMNVTAITPPRYAVSQLNLRTMPAMYFPATWIAPIAERASYGQRAEFAEYLVEAWRF